MTSPTTEPDRSRVTRAASGLQVPRPIARALLRMPCTIRNEVLSEVIRCGPGATLAYLRTQPTVRAL